MTIITTATDPRHGDGVFANPLGGGAGANPAPGEQEDRGPLYHFLVGSPQRIRATIRLLQARHYVDWDRWTNLMNIPKDGLIIRPTLREMYAYLDIPPWRD